MSRFSRASSLLAVFAAVFAVAALATLPSARNNWNSSFEGDPPDSDPISEGNEWVQKTKEETRRRLEVEHAFGTGFTPTSVDNGLHREGSARCFFSSTAPTALSDSAADWDPTDGTGETSLTATGSNSDSRTVGEGRCWVDTGSGVAHIHNGTEWVPMRNSGMNLVRNGGFELGDDGGSNPDPDPTGWTSANTDGSTPNYTTVPAAEGEGLEINLTGDGVAAATLSQTLSGLKGSQRYYAVVRYQATAGDSCDMTSSGADTDLSITPGTSTSYDTLDGFFITDSSGSDVTLALAVGTSTDSCAFDRVGVYEAGVVPSSSTAEPDYAENVDNDLGLLSSGDVDFDGGIVSIDSPNCRIVVYGYMAVEEAGAAELGVDVTLNESVNGGVFNQVGPTYGFSISANGVRTSASPVFLRASPTPGSTYQYRLTASRTTVAGDGQIDNVSLLTQPICPGT